MKCFRERPLPRRGLATVLTNWAPAPTPLRPPGCWRVPELWLTYRPHQFLCPQTHHAPLQPETVSKTHSPGLGHPVQRPLLVPRALAVAVQLLNRVRLFATPWTAAHQASLAFTSSQGLLKLMSIESGMPPNQLTILQLCHLPPPVPPPASSSSCLCAGCQLLYASSSMPAVYYCTFQGTVLEDEKCFIFCFYVLILFV